MRSRLLIVLAALLSLCFSYFAANGAGFEPAFDPDTEAEITVAGSYNNFEALEAMFEEFGRYYPNVEMSYLKLDSYNNTIATALYGEEAPDIYCMQTWMISREPYQILFDRAENLSDPDLNIDLSGIRPGLIYHDPNGETPMLPIFSTAFGVLVNENLFRKEGLTIPTTFDELVAVTQKLKEAGCQSPIMGFNSNLSMFYSLEYPDFVSRIKDNPEAIQKLNALDPEAGEYLRPTLEFVKSVMDLGMIDLEKCAEEIPDDYQGMILRFFEGDVPMIVVNGDTVSGTAKRESLSESFMEHPFRYSFHLIPSSNEIGFFLNPLLLAFAVNKNSADLEMTNEFIRYIASAESLNRMAQIKRLITPSKDFSLDKVYDSLGDFDEAHTIHPQALGLLDDAIQQMRFAAYAVANGKMTIDEAIAAYGTLE